MKYILKYRIDKTRQPTTIVLSANSKQHLKFPFYMLNAIQSAE